MGKNNKFILKLISGQSDANIGFDELCQFLVKLNFTERIKGSHHIFTRDKILERIILQKDGAKAKPYQVRQVRKILLNYGLTGDIENV